MCDTDPKFAGRDRHCLRQLRKLGLEFTRFFDIGASNGAWTRHVCQDFPDATFDMFEPLLDFAPSWRARIDSTLTGPKFRVHTFALGATSGSARLRVYSRDLPGSTMLPGASSVPDSTIVEIQMRTLDDFIASQSLAPPQVIKIDTQGYELEILKGARRTLPQVSVLVLECWLVRDYGQATPLLLEIVDWLRNFDFHLWDFADQWRNGEGLLVTQDCFFLNARSGVSRLANEPRRLVADLDSAPQTTERSFRLRDWLARSKRVGEEVPS